MFSNEEEYVPFTETFHCAGAVENYLCDLERAMQVTLREILEASKQTADGWDLGDVYKPRHIWLEDYNAQISLLATQIIWTEETIRQFDDMDGGSENAMKDYLVLIKKRIDELIKRVRHPLSKELRVKIITIITIDVHERDVIKMFVEKKIADQGHFKW
jgi:dynein heavy chain